MTPICGFTQRFSAVCVLSPLKSVQRPGTLTKFAAWPHVARLGAHRSDRIHLRGRTFRPVRDSPKPTRANVASISRATYLRGRRHLVSSSGFHCREARKRDDDFDQHDLLERLPEDCHRTGFVGL